MAKQQFDLVVPAIVGGVVVVGYIYRDEITKALDKVVSVLDSANIKIYPLPPLPLPQPQPQPTPNPTQIPVGGASEFGGGAVSLHGLQSGGSSWRKQWNVHRRYLNCQFSGYFLIPSGNKGIAIKLRGGPHNDSAAKEGCCYIFFLPFNGSSKNNFQKECPHPDYSKHTVGVMFNPGSILGKWTGVRCRVMNQGNGVRCQMWLDTSGKAGANQWRLWYDFVDTGQFGDSASTKPPFTKSPVNGNRPQAIVRLDGDSKSQVSGYQMAYASIGEIAGSNLAYAMLGERITVS